MKKIMMYYDTQRIKAKINIHIHKQIKLLIIMTWFRGSHPSELAGSWAEWSVLG